jgi:hypothetical protein
VRRTPFLPTPAIVTAIQKRKQACRDTFLSPSFGTHTKRSYSVLVGIIPSAAGNLILGIRLVLHVMVNFVVISGTTVVSAIIRDEILEFVAVMRGFLRDLGRLIVISCFTSICKP